MNCIGNSSIRWSFSVWPHYPGLDTQSFLLPGDSSGWSARPRKAQHHLKLEGHIFLLGTIPHFGNIPSDLRIRRLRLYKRWFFCFFQMANTPPHPSIRHSFLQYSDALHTERSAMRLPIDTVPVTPPGIRATRTPKKLLPYMKLQNIYSFRRINGIRNGLGGLQWQSPLWIWYVRR